MYLCARFTYDSTYLDSKSDIVEHQAVSFLTNKFKRFFYCMHLFQFIQIQNQMDN